MLKFGVLSGPVSAEGAPLIIGCFNRKPKPQNLGVITGALFSQHGTVAGLETARRSDPETD